MLSKTTAHGDCPSWSGSVALLLGATTFPSASRVGSMAPPEAAAALALAPGSMVTIFELPEGDAGTGVTDPEPGLGVAAGVEVDPDPLA